MSLLRHPFHAYFIMLLTGSAELNSSLAALRRVQWGPALYILDFATRPFPHERNNGGTNASALALVRNSIKFIGVIDSRPNRYVFAQQRESEYEQEQLRQNKHLCLKMCTCMQDFIQLACQQHLRRWKVMPSPEPDVIYNNPTWEFFSTFGQHNTDLYNTRCF